VNQIRQDNRPLYMLVIDRIRELAEGDWPPGTKLPSEFELARQFGVSRATLREALRVLEEEGFVVRRHGVGTFIRERQIVQAGLEQLFSVTEWIRRAGRVPGMIGLQVHEAMGTPEELASFGLPEPVPFLTITRIRTADGQPVVYCEDRLPAALLPNGMKAFEGSLFELLDSVGKPIAYAQTAIRPVAHHEVILPALRVQGRQAVLHLEQMHYGADDVPILLSSNFFHTEAFQFHVVRRRL